MHHDGNTNNCPKEGFIMSPSRGITGELLWSECSAQVAKNLNNFECLFKQSSSRHSTTVQKLNHNKFEDKPGQAWDAKKQCELLLLDSDARVMSTETNLDSSRQQPE
ncbi:A disintegrin and metalloproteinase with thrombospondin motifs adt-2-like, partial [Aphis craccivora]